MDAANCCFVQFPHPGAEPSRHGGRSWHMNAARHKRKFMELCGHWMDAHDNQQTGSLFAWGEWEPESDLVTCFPRNGLHPRYLWRPYYIPKCNYGLLHNTDPFIFGPRFLYSSCHQPWRPGLRQLDRGTVIAFGSSKKIDRVWRWMLDTVFVVRDSKDYRASHAIDDLRDCVPAAFLDVSIRPLCATQGDEGGEANCTLPPGERLRLYTGATPDSPVDGMFSFFPANPADSSVGFPRPLIDLPRYLNASSSRGPSGFRFRRRPHELREIWASLAGQVRDAGLVLGTCAELPVPRAAA